MTLELFWTEDRVAEMRRLAEEGLTASAIGWLLGCSRNAIIGKSHWIGVRLGRRKSGPEMPHRPMAAKRPEAAAAGGAPAKRKYTKRQGTAASRRATPRLGVSRPASPSVVPEAGCACGILDVTGCRWPVGHDDSVPGGHLFCNSAVESSHSYCSTHLAANVAAYSRQLIRDTVRSAIRADRPRGRL